jgi:hypothetical protein
MIQDVCLIEIDDISTQTNESMTLDKDFIVFFVLFDKLKRKNFFVQIFFENKREQCIQMNLVKVKYANVKRKKETGNLCLNARR